MNKKLKYSWVKVPVLVMATFVVIIAAEDAFAETEVTIPNEASDISCAESSNSVQPHGQQPTRLPCPWNSPGKSTGVGCHLYCV